MKERPVVPVFLQNYLFSRSLVNGSVYKIKKIIFIVAIFVSLVILFFIITDLVNSQVSYKYEIDDPIVGDYIDKEFASGYLIGKIRWLKVFFILCRY